MQCNNKHYVTCGVGSEVFFNAISFGISRVTVPVEGVTMEDVVKSSKGQKMEIHWFLGGADG